MSLLAVAKPTRPRRFKRLAAILAGWTFVALGIVGLFLPFLQGILFVMIGLVILSKEHHWASRLVSRLRSHFPKLERWLNRVHPKIDSVFGHSQDKNPRTARE